MAAQKIKSRHFPTKTDCCLLWSDYAFNIGFRFFTKYLYVCCKNSDNFDL